MFAFIEPNQLMTLKRNHLFILLLQIIIIIICLFVILLQLKKKDKKKLDEYINSVTKNRTFIGFTKIKLYIFQRKVE